MYKCYYDSPIGKLLLVSTETSLIGLWIENQKYYLENVKTEPILKEDIDILKKAKHWLDRYFKGEKPKISEIPLAPNGNAFRQNVWKILCEIPYGETITYGELAKKIANNMDKPFMSAQAVGNAISHNPILIIIPCHRVIGSSGNLTGYAGGIDKKRKLLMHENKNIFKEKGV